MPENDNPGRGDPHHDDHEHLEGLAMEGNGFDMDHPGGGHAYDPQHRSVRDDVLTEAWPANVKRTYDEYQELSLTSRRNLEQRMGEISLLALHNITNAQSNDQNIQALALRAINNALSHDTAINQQQIRHADLAIDRHWNGIARFQTLRTAEEHVAGGHGAGHPSSPEAQLA